MRVVSYRCHNEEAFPESRAVFPSAPNIGQYLVLAFGTPLVLIVTELGWHQHSHGAGYPENGTLYVGKVCAATIVGEYRRHASDPCLWTITHLTTWDNLLRSEIRTRGRPYVDSAFPSTCVGRQEIWKYESDGYTVASRTTGN